MSNNINNPGTAGDPSEGLLRMIRNRTKALAGSALLTLKSHGPPLRGILAGEASLAGDVLRFCGGRSAPLPFSLTRIADDPPTFRLNVDGWPDGWTLLAVFVGQFRYWQFAVPSVQGSLGDMAPPEVTEAQDQPPCAEEDHTRLAPEEAGDEVVESYPSLAAHGSVAEVEEPAVSAASSDVGFEYFPDRETLEVTATLPEGSNGETLVAELRSGQQTVRRAVHLDYRLPDGEHKGKYKKNVFGFRPPVPRGDVALVLRPMADDDLGLLEPNAVQALLGRQNYVSLPAERTNEGFLFSARWPDQRELAADTSACWVLCIAAGKEG